MSVLSRGFDDGARGANGKLVTTANRKHAGTLTTCAEGAPETYYEMTCPNSLRGLIRMIRRAVTIRPEGFAAPPQRNDANCVVTTHRGFDDGAWGANGELYTTANRKHVGTLITACAERCADR